MSVGQRLKKLDACWNKLSDAQRAEYARLDAEDSNEPRVNMIPTTAEPTVKKNRKVAKKTTKKKNSKATKTTKK